MSENEKELLLLIGAIVIEIILAIVLIISGHLFTSDISDTLVKVGICATILIIIYQTSSWWKESQNGGSK
jgi:hypothetical protein